MNIYIYTYIHILITRILVLYLLGDNVIPTYGIQPENPPSVAFQVSKAAALRLRQATSTASQQRTAVVLRGWKLTMVIYIYLFIYLFICLFIYICIYIYIYMCVCFHGCSMCFYVSSMVVSWCFQGFPWFFCVSLRAANGCS